MPKKRITAVLFILTVVLAGAAFFFLKDIDRSRPVITFADTPISYTEGEDTSVLLADVTAFDEHDGDLTGEIRVNQITPIDNATHARVTYVVIDARKNIATATRIVDYTPLPDELSDESLSDTSVSEETEGGLPDEEALAGTDGESGDAEPNPEAPVLVLSTGSDTLSSTEAFNYMAYIASITDDVDSRETLYRNIIIEGDYSSTRIGSYPLTIYVRDSDGNESNKETFILNRG